MEATERCNPAEEGAGAASQKRTSAVVSVSRSIWHHASSMFLCQFICRCSGTKERIGGT